MIKKYLSLLILILPLFAIAATITDTLPSVNDTIKTISRQRIYLEKNGDSFICNRPKPFNFVTHIPGDAVGYVKQSFRKENLYKVGIVAASTALLIIFDQKITDGVQGFSKRNGISAREDFDPILRIKILGKNTNIGKMPHNVNTAFYNIGQGSSVILMAAGFYIGGLIKKDNRALQTSSQLVESFLALGLGTQLMKYSTGRENPQMQVYLAAGGGHFQL